MHNKILIVNIEFMATHQKNTTQHDICQVDMKGFIARRQCGKFLHMPNAFILCSSRQIYSSKLLYCHVLCTAYGLMRYFQKDICRYCHLMNYTDFITMCCKLFPLSIMLKLGIMRINGEANKKK